MGLLVCMHSSGKIQVRFDGGMARGSGRSSDAYVALSRSMHGEKTPEYSIIGSPLSRLATADVGRFGLLRHSMFGLFEVDVTAARRQLRDQRRNGREISFTAWIIKAIGDCVARNPLVHALRWKRNALIAFRDVDIAMPVERLVDGKGVPLPLLITRVNRKTAQDIHREIQEALEKPISDEKDFILGPHEFSRVALRTYYSLPQAIRLALWRALFSNPFRARRHSGTVMVTTVNAIGGSSGWILPIRTIHNLALSLGSISRKPWIVDGHVAIRDIMNLTVSFNHDVIDGMPARRFAQDLIAHIERCGVEERPDARTGIGGASPD
jgi:pyruvate/2-oxoglutarate dehydrogenase complex dihydrolipoamide acyltransferase (E2) component